MSPSLHWIAWSCVVVASLGCSGRGPAGGKAKAEPFAADVKALPFDDTVEYPPLDNGKLRIQMLQDWKESNSKGGNLVVMQQRGGKAYPVILIAKAEDAGIPELNDETKEKFTTEEAAAQKFTMLKPRAVEIAGRTWIGASQSQKSTNGEALEATTLTTVAGGRKYRLLMRSVDGQAHADWPALYSVASGMTFGEKAVAPAAESKPDDKSAQKMEEKAAKE